MRLSWTRNWLFFVIESLTVDREPMISSVADDIDSAPLSTDVAEWLLCWLIDLTSSEYMNDWPDVVGEVVISRLSSETLWISISSSFFDSLLFER